MFKKAAPYFVLLAVCFVYYPAVFSQQGFHIPQQGKVFFHGDTATIFSDVLNNGLLGIEGNAVLNFKGRTWNNHPQSRITDASNFGLGVTGQGGLVRFMADSIRQILNGGYNAAVSTGPVFANLQVLNTYGVQLTGSSTKVYKEMAFKRGRLYLNDQTFVVGNGYPGSITGYDSSRYFVTGSKTGSLLLRENISQANGPVTFPIGTRDFAYTPASIRSTTSRADDYYATVFDSVRSGIFSGDVLVKESVNKTWQLGKRRFPGEGSAEIQLQHLVADEGSSFAAARSRSYISQYSNNKWDVYNPQNSPAAGTLTTGAALANSGLNNRVLSAQIFQSSYFTKLVADKDTSLKTNLFFTGFRLSALLVRLDWQTKPEINVKQFVVERRLSNEATFRSIDTVASRALNGYNSTQLNYGLTDSNSYAGISFYRLKLLDYNGGSYYSPIIGVRGVSFHYITLWPNPTPDAFNIVVYGHVTKKVVIHNSLGQIVWIEDVGGRNVFEIKGHRLPAGVYYVSSIGNDNNVLQIDKLLIMR